MFVLCPCPHPAHTAPQASNAASHGAHQCSSEGKPPSTHAFGSGPSTGRPDSHSVSSRRKPAAHSAGRRASVKLQPCRLPPRQPPSSTASSAVRSLSRGMGTRACGMVPQLVGNRACMIRDISCGNPRAHSAGKGASSWPSTVSWISDGSAPGLPQLGGSAALRCGKLRLRRAREESAPGRMSGRGAARELPVRSSLRPSGKRGGHGRPDGLGCVLTGAMACLRKVVSHKQRACHAMPCHARAGQGRPGQATAHHLRRGKAPAVSHSNGMPCQGGAEK